MSARSPNYTLFNVLVVLGLLLAGCQRADVAAPPLEEPILAVEATTPLQQTTSVDLKTEMKATQTWRIAFVPKEKFYARTGDLGAYWQPAWEGAEQAGRDFGVNVELVALDVFCETDTECVEPQIRLIANLIERGDIDGMVVAPLDSNRLTPVVDRAIAAGIPVIAMDTPINTDQLLTFVAFDNFTAGQVVGEWVVEQLGGRGKALILEGPSDQQNAVERRNGFLAGLQSGDIDVLDTQSADWEIEPAREATVAWLREYSDIDVIMAANDDMALGAAEAIVEADRQGIVLTGFDATDVGLAAIEAEQMAATIDQAPGKQARLAVQLLIRHLETGETFPSIILMPEIPLVTKESVRDYMSR